MVNFTVKKETKKKWCKWNFSNEITFRSNRSITMDASVRRTKCIQYNLTYNYNSILLIIAFIYEISFRIIKYCFT